jgi:hypothetical protein
MMSLILSIQLASRNHQIEIIRPINRSFIDLKAREYLYSNRRKASNVRGIVLYVFKIIHKMKRSFFSFSSYLAVR